MNPQEIDRLVRGELARLAPEADLGSLDPTAPLRETLDLDSLDFLNFVVALNQVFGVTIPEADYPAVSTLGGCVEYLRARVAGITPGAPPPSRP